MKLMLLMCFVLIASCASNSKKEMSEAKAAKEAVKKEAAKAKDSAKKEMAKASKKSDGLMKTCTIADIKRTIEIKKSDDGCEVLYTKSGETTTVANAKNDLDYCSSVQDRITTKLSDAGFSCQ